MTTKLAIEAPPPLHTPSTAPQVFLRIVFPDYQAVGPYGTSFLEAIETSGSIGGAARVKGITYRRAWLIVRNLNVMFGQPLIATRQGRGGGAQLTEAGAQVVALFRDAEREASAALRRHAAAFAALRYTPRATPPSVGARDLSGLPRAREAGEGG